MARGIWFWCLGLWLSRAVISLTVFFYLYYLFLVVLNVAVFGAVEQGVEWTRQANRWELINNLMSIRCSYLWCTQCIYANGGVYLSRPVIRDQISYLSYEHVFGSLALMTISTKRWKSQYKIDELTFLFPLFSVVLHSSHSRSNVFLQIYCWLIVKPVDGCRLGQH